MYMSSPLYEATPETAVTLPWFPELAKQGAAPYFDLRTFAYICKVRSIQSFFMHLIEKDSLEDTVPLELEMHMLKTLREWEDPEAVGMHR